MERLTAFDGELWIHKNFPPVEEDRVDEFIDCVKDLASRLATIENILGDDYDLERLKELVEADREGRCVALPCKVGSMVYMPFCNDVVKKRIGQFHVNGYTSPRIWADIYCDWSTTQSVRWDLAFGKTVFFTEKEAEAALENLKR